MIGYPFENQNIKSLPVQAIFQFSVLKYFDNYLINYTTHKQISYNFVLGMDRALF